MMANSDRNSQMREYTAELAELVMEMASTKSLESCRAVFRPEVHRAFEPDFLPALIQLLSVMSQADGNGHVAASNIFAGIVFELDEFLTALDPKSMGTAAISLEILTRQLAANLEPTTSSVPGIEVAKVILRHREHIHSVMQKVCVEIDEIAIAADHRSKGEGTLFELMKEQAANWRQTAAMAQLMDHVVSLCDNLDVEAVKHTICDARPGSENLQRLEVLLWLEHACREVGDNLTAGQIQELSLAIAWTVAAPQSTRLRLSLEDTEEIFENLLRQLDRES